MMYCFMCGIEMLSLATVENVNKKSPFSKKSLRAILGYLAKSTSTQIELQWPEATEECYVCMTCLDDLLHYDECMMKVLTVQKRILASIQNGFKQANKLEHSEELITLEDESIIVMNGNNATDTCEQDIINEDEISVDNAYENMLTTQEEDNNDLSDDEDTQWDVKTVKNNQLRKYNVPVTCELCNKLFRNKTSLNKHIKSEHKARKKTCKCNECGVTFKDEEYLELHMNVHEGKSEMECRYCSRRYTRRVNVIRHMQKHWDKKKFQCEKCGLRFSEVPVLYNHRLQHEAEEEPLVCDVCKQSFKTRRTYKNHMWTHREDRPRFSCQICGKTFVEKYTLKVHLRTHSQEEPVKSTWRRKIPVIPIQAEKKSYDCVICGESFLNKDKFNEHMAEQHDVITYTE